MKKALLLILFLATFALVSCTNDTDDNKIKPIDEHFHTFTDKQCECGYKIEFTNFNLGEKVDFATINNKHEISSFDLDSEIFQLICDSYNNLPTAYTAYTKLSLGDNNYEIAGNVYNAENDEKGFLFTDVTSHFSSADGNSLYGQNKFKVDNNGSIYTYNADKDNVLLAVRNNTDPNNRSIHTLKNGLVYLGNEYKQFNFNTVTNIHDFVLKNLIRLDKVVNYEDYYNYSFEIYENYLVLKESNPFGYNLDFPGSSLEIIMKSALAGNSYYKKTTYINLKTGVIDLIDVEADILTFSPEYLGKKAVFTLRIENASKLKTEIITNCDKLVAFVDKYAIYKK